jgi:hypothetical protein
MSDQQETSETADQDFRYWAFISYSQHDVKWAERLHRQLETYRVPRAWHGRRIGGRSVAPRLVPVFRDRDELASAGNLSDKINEALNASHALIVLCSPYAAASPWVNEEVRAFKALGRAHRIFPLILDGEPYASERPQLGLPECFPPALRFAVAADGTVTDQRSDPLAADAREGKDGWSNACLKLIAGILGVGFDDLRQRELVRRRQRRLSGVVASLAALLFMGAAYVGLADDDFRVPGGAEIRRQLDRYGLSVFRPIDKRDEVVRTASRLRQQLRQRLAGALKQGELALKGDGLDSIWTIAQVSAAIYRDSGASDEDVRPIPPMFERMFKDDFPVKLNGRPIGWRGDGQFSRLEAVLWAMMALTHALTRAGEESEALRANHARYLDTVQEMAEHYYPLRDGGWNILVQDEPTDHSVYSSALALHALLELKSANLCWRGDCEQRDRMIQATARWLIASFADERPLQGWRTSAIDDNPPNQELSLLVYGILRRSPVPIPDVIEKAALRHLEALRFQSYYPPSREITHWVTILNSQGQKDSVIVRTVIFWYAWGTEALVNWLRHAYQSNYPPETTRALERSLGHMMVGEAETVMAAMAKAPLYVVAEIYYGLDGTLNTLRLEPGTM